MFKTLEPWENEILLRCVYTLSKLETLIHLNNFIKVKWHYHFSGFSFFKLSNARYLFFLNQDYSFVVSILRIFSWMKIVLDCYMVRIWNFYWHAWISLCYKWRMIWFNDKWLIHFGVIILIFSEIHEMTFLLWRYCSHITWKFIVRMHRCHLKSFHLNQIHAGNSCIVLYSSGSLVSSLFEQIPVLKLRHLYHWFDKWQSCSSKLKLWKT